MWHHVREAGGEDDAAGETREAGDEHPTPFGPLPPTVRRHRAAVLAARFHRRRGSHAPHSHGGQHAGDERDGAEEHHRHDLCRCDVHVSGSSVVGRRMGE